MKRLILLSFALLICNVSYNQTLIGCFGANVTNGVYLSYTGGEIITSTVSNNYILTQGFQQNLKVYITEIKENVDGTLVTPRKVNIKVYPNPTTDLLNIKTEDIIKFVVLYNADGQMIFNSEVNDMSFSFNTISYPTGIYFITIICAAKEYSIKVVKR